jgi:hypothetical protein
MSLLAVASPDVPIHADLIETAPRSGLLCAEPYGPCWRPASHQEEVSGGYVLTCEHCASRYAVPMRDGESLRL